MDALAVLSKALGDKTPSSIKELAKVLIEIMFSTIMAAMTEVKASVSSFDESLKFHSQGFDEFRAELKAVRQELSEGKKRSHEHERERHPLVKELRDAKKEIVDLKQYSRRTNLQLKGVPLTEKEDLGQTLHKVATCLSVPLSDHNVDVVHRVPTKGGGLPNIIVKFSSRATRDRLLFAAKQKRLNASLLGYQVNIPVYVNAHLCPEKKNLLGKAIQCKREKNWKFAWVADGKILMLKSENSRVVHVTMR
nr:uncharacterized protein LOC119187107 [Rhipicephalus microplus]